MIFNDAASEGGAPGVLAVHDRPNFSTFSILLHCPPELHDAAITAYRRAREGGKRLPGPLAGSTPYGWPEP